MAEGDKLSVGELKGKVIADIEDGYYSVMKNGMILSGRFGVGRLSKDYASVDISYGDEDFNRAHRAIDLRKHLEENASYLNINHFGRDSLKSALLELLEVL